MIRDLISATDRSPGFLMEAFMGCTNRVQQPEREDADNNLLLLQKLSGKSVLITGATGLIGAELAKTLLCYNRRNDADIRIIVCGRNKSKLDKMYDGLSVTKIVSDIREPFSIEGTVDHIIHCASATSSPFFVKKPVDTIRTTLEGTANLLELARIKNVKGFLFTSSLEVYGIPPKQSVTECDYGYIDFLNVRSSYSEGKRMAECLCKAYASQYGIPVKIVRLTQTIGPGIEYDDNRVFAQFARCAIEKQDIILNTPGRTVRSYCDITDAVRGIFTVLLRGEAGEAYNIANKDTTISIADMARFVCDHFAHAGIKVVFHAPDDIDSLGYNPEMQISLDTSKIEALGWKPEVDLKTIFRKLIDGLREKRDNG